MDDSRNFSRMYIIEALFLLLEQTSFDDITIADLCIKAGVSRVTYYRNFDYKTDIIKAYFKDLIREHKSKCIKEDNLTAKKIVDFGIEIIFREQGRFKLLKDNRLLGYYLKCLNDYTGTLAAVLGFSLESSSIYAGAFFNYSGALIDGAFTITREEAVDTFIKVFAFDFTKVVKWKE